MCLINKLNLISRNKIFICRIILIVSLFWATVDVFLIIKLTEYLPTKTIPKEKIEYAFTNFKEEKYPKIGPADKTQILTETYVNDSPITVKSKTNENPTDWPGEQGKPVVLPKHLEKLAEERFKENYFNVVVSDMIALNRSVGEQRNKKCLQKVYGDDLPNTSIIIIYHNEANSTLLRGLTSLVRKTPSKYLKEIILVDDASLGREYLHEPLDKFVKALPVKVQIFRNEVRQGLIRSRLIGAAAATGDTLTFLDAHIEATDGWIEPLLYEIKMNRQASF